MTVIGLGFLTQSVKTQNHIMSKPKRPSGAQFRKRAKDRGKQANVFSSLLCSWLNRKKDNEGHVDDEIISEFESQEGLTVTDHGAQHTADVATDASQCFTSTAQAQEQDLNTPATSCPHRNVYGKITTENDSQDGETVTEQDVQQTADVATDTSCFTTTSAQEPELHIPSVSCSHVNLDANIICEIENEEGTTGAGHEVQQTADVATEPPECHNRTTNMEEQELNPPSVSCSQALQDPKSGKFRNMIELVSHYHVPLCEHLQRHKKGQVSYFSPEIQNQFLDIIAGKVREHILNDVREAKYFSVMFDCTPDISHLEQMSEVLRYVKITECGPEIVESFIDFFVVSEKTGLALTELILQKIEKDGLDITNCRGQSYDNGANMAGKYKGVQARLLQENKLAFFVPCAAHSLNLVGVNAASVSRQAETFFGTLHCLYLFFVASTFRWEVLQKHVTVTLKSLSKTRWSAKLDAVKPIYMHLSEIIDTLNDLKTSSVTNMETKTEAASLMYNIKKFEFVIMSCFWYKVLSQIDRVNKLLQQETITIDMSAKHIHGLLNLLESTRTSYATDAINEAKTIAERCGLDPNFRDVRKRKVNRMFDEECEDESVLLSQEDKFRIALVEISDKILSEMRTRFEAIDKLNDIFGFLTGSQFDSLSTQELKEKATQLSEVYENDLDKDEIILEVESFKYHALDFNTSVRTATPASLLTFIYKNGLQDAYPNIAIALRIFLTIPVTVASSERSFSKLKLLKTYLRSVMGQQRLTSISIISIEHEIAAKISYDDIIKTFAAIKARKVKM